MALTETQKNFRRFQKEQGITKKLHRRKKINWSIFIMVLLLVSIFNGLPQKIYQEIQIERHAQIKQYLDTSGEYSSFQINYITPIIEQLPNVNVALVQNLIRENIKYEDIITSLSPVKSFQEHQAKKIELIEHIDLFLHEIERIGITKDYDHVYVTHLNKQLIQLNSDVIDGLKKGFKQENISYHYKNDATIKYKIKIHPGEKKMDS